MIHMHTHTPNASRRYFLNLFVTLGEANVCIRLHFAFFIVSLFDDHVFAQYRFGVQRYMYVFFLI